jgi:DNA polymerase-4
MRSILHVDLNSFFASAEQQAHPELRGKPIGILKAKGRTCIIAASNEAKSFGLHTGIPLSEARHLCPNLILVPANFPYYEHLTKKFINLCADFSDVVEVFSLDEVFLDITDTAWWFGGALSLARKLQARVALEMGEAIGCSIGIAENKLLAKMAGGMAPRRGILIVDETNKAELLSRAPFTEVCGIGYRLTKRLKMLGINNLPQIAAAGVERLRPHFGPFWSRRLVEIARGEDDTPLTTTNHLHQAKSVSRTYTLYADTTDQNQIKALIRNLVEEAAWKLRRMNLVGRQFGLGIRGGGTGQWGHITTKTCVATGRQIFEAVYTIYNSWRWREPVRFAGVWIGLLEPKNTQTEWLFPKERKNEFLWQRVDKINRKYGIYSVFPGTLINQQIIRPEVNGYLGDKHFQLIDK